MSKPVSRGPRPAPPNPCVHPPGPLTAEDYEALEAWQREHNTDVRFEARALIDGPTPRTPGRGFAFYCAGKGEPLQRITSMAEWDEATKAPRRRTRRSPGAQPTPAPAEGATHPATRN